MIINFLLKMSYAELRNILPKKTVRWSIADVRLWLSSIGLDYLHKSFEENLIDGSCLRLLNEDDLRGDLQVKSNISIRRILKWADSKFDEYDQYLDLYQSMSIAKEKNEKLCSSSKTTFTPFTAVKHTEGEKQTINYLQVFDPLSKVVHRVHKSSMIIDAFGLHPPCKMPVNDFAHSDAFVVDYRKGKYYLGSLPEKENVFVEIHKPVQLINGMEFRIANAHYEAKITETNLNLFHRELRRNLWVNEFPHPFITSSADKVRIFEHNNQFYIANWGEGNGLWLKLKNGIQFEVKSSNNIKVGLSEKMFTCSIPENQVDENEKCTICNDRSRRCVIWRCMHHATCLKCVKTLDKCPICRNEIEDITNVHNF